MRLKLCIFDLDGVICDTAKYHYIAWKDLADKIGIDFTIDDNERLKGVSREESLNILLSLGEKTYTEDEKADMAKEKNDYYIKLISNMKKEEIFPNIKDFLLELRENGIKTAIGSASKNADTVLSRLEIPHLFDYIVDGNMVENPKPDPEVFTLAAQHFDYPYNTCVVFEDAVAGIEAAKRAQMMAIGVGEENILSNSDFVIKDFSNFTLETMSSKLKSFLK